MTVRDDTRCARQERKLRRVSAESSGQSLRGFLALLALLLLVGDSRLLLDVVELLDQESASDSTRA